MVLIIHVHDRRQESSSQVFSVYFSSVRLDMQAMGDLYWRCVVMVTIIAARGARDA